MHGYLQVGEVSKDDIQIARRWRTQLEKPSSRSPDVVFRAVHLRKQQLSPSMRISKATASTMIATGNLRKGRLMADHGRLYSATKPRQIVRLKMAEAKAGCARVAFPIVKGEREGGLW